MSKIRGATDHAITQNSGLDLEKSLPRFVRLAPAQLHRDELLLPVGEHSQRDQHRDARHALVHPHPQRDRVEVEKRHVEVRQRPLLPSRQLALERPDHARDRALRERRRLEQRPQRAGDAPCVGSRQVRRQDRLVDLPHTPLVARHQFRSPLLRAAGREEPRPRQRQLQRPSRPGQRPHLRAVALPAARLAALVQLDAQHLRQLLVNCLLDGGADVLVDQDSEGELLFMHQLQLLDSLAHGVFLRSSPWPATGWWFPNRKNAPFSFSTSPGARPGTLAHRSRDG